MVKAAASRSHPAQGFTIIEILVTTFIIGTVVTGIFGLFVLSIRLSQESERRIVAVALANEKMELVRNLPYTNVGTVGGIPSGPLLQTEDVSRNGLTYTVTTDIRYVDDYFDGETPGQTNGEEKITICHKPGGSVDRTLEVPASALDAHLAHGDSQGACGSGGQGTEAGDEFNADYKQVRVEVSWNSNVKAKPVLLITYIVPQGIEGGDLGGTLDFLAIDSAGAGIEGATVRLVNDSVTPAIDFTTQANSEGRLVLPGLPESAGSYEISVTKDGYTPEQTYDSSATFTPNTDHSHLSMVLREVTSKTFIIDLLSQLHITAQDDQGQPVAIPMTLRGTKTIGIDDEQQPVHVFNETDTTNASGEIEYTDLVWDTYTLSINGQESGYDIKETSFPIPLVITPGQSVDLLVTLVPHTPFSLHATILSLDNEPIDNATVQLTDSGTYDQTRSSGVPGQVFFEDLPSSGTYTMDISAPGYQAQTSPLNVEGTEDIQIQLTPTGF